MNILQVTEKAEYFQKPDNKHNNNYDIKDVFDFTIHRNVIIDKP